jgi:D-serine deaminase-like pyridoxal phosphate-dependent protein
VVVTVVSHSAQGRAVVDAGSKALTSDRGAHGKASTEGHGRVKGHPGIVIERLSEEHGWLRLGEGESVAIGEKLDIIPNHACPVANNFTWAAVTRGDEVVERWKVDARGCMT